MSVSYGGSSITFEDGSIVSSGSQGFKNKIINGAMMIDQRNAGAAVSTGTNFYTLDRWNIIAQTSAKITVQQMNSANSAVSNYESSSAPTGYINSLKVSVGASAGVTIGATDQYIIRQLIEGYNVADLDWGLSTAKTVTLSFWVKSSVIGTFGGALASNGGVAYPFTYSISSPNTWEQKSITITGSTTGTWLKDNQNGINVSFSLGVGATYSGTSGAWASTYYANATGSVKLVETNSATFYITGVQLEKGTTASSFEFRSYGKELMLCQRYYQLYTATSVEWIYNESATTNQKWWQCYLNGATMRAAPSAAFIGSWTGGTSGGLTGTISSMSVVEVSLNRLVVRVAMSADGGTAHLVYHTDGWATKQISFSSEL